MLLALDLGTTSLAGRILEVTGRIVAESQIQNPQVVYGSDVLRRLEAARNGEGKALQATLATGVNDLVGELLRRSGVEVGSITTAAAAANPAISILLQNLSPDPILFPPYRPKSCHAVMLSPAEVGIELPVPLFLFPLVNGFVGGDLVAFLLGQDAPKVPTLYIDIGTNGELALFSKGRWWVTSVAAGPAFEGGEIGSGMLFGPGAITGCRIDDDRLRFDVVGAGSPRGLCGSGLAEVIAVALENGLLDRHGSIVAPDQVPNNLARYVVPGDNGFSLLLFRDADGTIILEQKDIRNFQLAKAAVHAGVSCLVDKAGIATDEIVDVVMTGAFGFSLSPEALKRVAILPANMVDKVRFEASGALNGVCRMLSLEEGPVQVEGLARMLRPYPLSGTPTFEAAFMKSIDF